MNGCEILEKSGVRLSAGRKDGATSELDQLVPGDQIRITTKADCACQRYIQHIDMLKLVYEQSGDIDKLLDAMQGGIYMQRPERVGNVIYVTKAPRFPVEHALAETPAEKRRFFCHCDNARASELSASQTYCTCGVGWCRKVWEGILTRPVTVEITQSVLQGDDICQFAVHL